MKEKIITKTKIKGDLKFEGKLIFEAGLGRVEIEGSIEADLIVTREGTNINSGGYIYSGGYINSRGYIYSGGDINSRGYIYSGGDIYFSYHIKFDVKITCKLLRISQNERFERSFWIEKFKLFGFKKVAKIIETGCVVEIKENVGSTKGIKAKLLKCKYWTKTEKMVLKSWLDGELKDYEIK